MVRLNPAGICRRISQRREVITYAYVQNAVISTMDRQNGVVFADEAFGILHHPRDQELRIQPQNTNSWICAVKCGERDCAYCVGQNLSLVDIATCVQGGMIPVPRNRVTSGVPG